MTLPVITLEVALGIGSGGFLIFDDPVLGLFDTGLLGPDLVWTDISNKVRKIKVKSPKRDRTLDGYTAGGITVELIDKTSDFDPTNTGSPYYVAGVTTLTPNRPIRLRATYNGITYPIWYGYSNRWRPQSNQRTNDQWCILTGTDGFKLIGRHNPTAVAPVGAGELSGARIIRLADNAGFSPALRRINTGNSTLQATTLSANTLSEMQLATASEQGALFIDREGYLVFLDRYDAILNVRSNTSQATFADASDPAALPFVEADIATDDEILINKINLARAGGTVQTVQDVTSIAVYSDGVPSTWGRSDLLNQTDSEVLDMATWKLAQFKTPENRFTRYTVRGEASPAAMWPKILDTRLRDRVTLKQRRRGSVQFVQQCFVEGFEHEINADANGTVDWLSDFYTVPTTGYGSFLVFDDAVLGLFDTGQLGF